MLFVEAMCFHVQNVFEDLKPKLSLYSLADTVQSTEHIETATLMLGKALLQICFPFTCTMG